jgi:ribosome-binding protein aMBF1 (putative translation factor)
MICPTCNNDPSQQVVTALVNRGKERGCEMEPHLCPTCDGAGDISEGHFERLAAGEFVRDARAQRRMTIFEFAQVAGVTPRDVSDYEHGKLPPDHDHNGVRDALYAAIERTKNLLPSLV